MLFSSLVLLLFCLIQETCEAAEITHGEIEYETLIPGRAHEVFKQSKKHELHIYCYGGEEKVINNLFKTLRVHINVSNNDYELYQGENASHVQQQFESTTRSYLALLPWQVDTLRIPAFNSSCLGIEAYSSFSVTLDIIKVDILKLLALVCGMFLFFSAGSLSRSTFFHYTSGVTLGVLASLLVVVYVISRMFPKKSSAAVILLAGWSVTLYLLQRLWFQMHDVMMQYSRIICAYLVSAAALSLIVCYRFGPVQDDRTMNLIKWGLQGCGLLLMYQCTEWHELSLGIIISTVIIYSFRTKQCHKSV